MTQAEFTHRVAALDGVRGFAALAVLPYHAILPLHKSGLKLLTTPIWEISGAYDRWFKFWLMVFNGQAAVVLFFILSGFVLIKSMERDFNSRSELSASVAFVVRRVLRIMPAVIACVLAIAVAMWALSKPFPMKAIIDNLLLISSSVNGASWTLQAEMLAIPFLLLAGLAMHRFGLISLWMFLLMAFIVTRKPSFSNALFYLDKNLLYFALGCLIPYYANLIRRVPLPLPWWGTLLAFLTVGQFIYLQAVMGALLIMQVYVTSPPLLTGHTACFFGRLSYSFYLWNVLFLQVFYSLSFFPGWFANYPVECGIVVSIVIAVLTVPVALFSVRFIENPGIELGRRLTSRTRPTTSPVLAEG